MLSFEDLIRPPTDKDVERILYGILADVGVQTSSWKPGSVARAIITGVSRFGGVMARLVTDIAKGGFLDTAEGNWLTFLAWQLYAVERRPATFAEGDVVLTNSGFGLYTIQPGDFVVSTPTGEQFRNVEVFTLNPSSTATVRVRAYEAGTANSAVPATVTEIVSTMVGVTCTNPLGFVGQDEELDEDLKVSCRQKLASLSNGWLADGIVYWITHEKRPADAPIGAGEFYGITRAEVQPADGYGSCIVYGATASGAVPAGDVVEIQTMLNKRAYPYSNLAIFLSATPKPINAACTVWVKSGGLTALEVKASVMDAIGKHVQRLPVGGQVTTGTGFVSWRSLIGAIEGAADGIIEAKLVTETNIPMNPDDVAVNATGLSDITVEIV